MDSQESKFPATLVGSQGTAASPPGGDLAAIVASLATQVQMLVAAQSSKRPRVSISSDSEGDGDGAAVAGVSLSGSRSSLDLVGSEMEPEVEGVDNSPPG